MLDHEVVTNEEEVEEVKEEKDWKKDVQRLLDNATDETARLIANMKSVIEENKDKLNVELVKEKVSEAGDAVVKVWNQANERINELAKDPKVAEKVAEYREKVKEGYQKASKAVVDAVDSLKENQELKDKLTDASEFVKETAAKVADKIVDVYKDVAD